ncbi:hypothetical protein UA08_07785 [Talaromyces atroroseus]|uniref:Endoplasmic reticulum lectin n=1 Tax=Talaromyces atroroseus TaxID=1441469 RepID=A0A225A8K5_TALAT|nr:hypothetical protein UA08_07785 [Talaromyces atroroseus]OKL56972.1 hypothetical protein UA08_07785 [Talaromyces atroroseus]
MYELSSGQVLATSYTMMAISGISILLRFFLRWLRGDPLQLEDGFMLFAFVGFYVLATITIILIPAAYRIIAAGKTLLPHDESLHADEVFQLKVSFAICATTPSESKCKSTDHDCAVMALPILFLYKARLTRTTYLRTAGIFSVGAVCIITAICRGFTIGTRMWVDTPTLPWIAIWEMIEGGIVYLIQSTKSASQRGTAAAYEHRSLGGEGRLRNWVTTKVPGKIQRISGYYKNRHSRFMAGNIFMTRSVEFKTQPAPSVSLLYLASIAITRAASAAKRPFSIHDDVLAFPQYDVLFPDEYVLESEADAILRLQKERLSGHSTPSNADSDKRDLQHHASQKPLGGGQSTGSRYGGGERGEGGLDWAPEASFDYFSYEEMKLDGLRYLCNIPRVGNNADSNTTSNTGNGATSDKTTEENEIARATDRGLELLQEMEGTCMYYVSGWWSYSFCYQKQIKQFHARSGAGVPNYPPIEDPTSHSFVLGKFQQDDDEDGESDPSGKETTSKSTAELQTKGESRYLVQRLAGGTICDLTGAERKVEVQFHCHPQSTDRIGWIKEITTCSYLMVIYTPRLCHDVAFQLPQPEDIHSIQCREILAPEEIEDFEAMKAHHESQKLVNSGASESQIIGGIEVGAMKQVGSEGKVIQKGRMAKIGEESVEVVAKREGGKLTQLSKEELKKWDLDPKEVESFQKQLDEMTDGKDWKLELVERNGDRIVQAIVDSNAEDDGKNGDADGDGASSGKQSKLGNDGETSNDNDDQQEQPASKEEDLPSEQELGSEETFKDEL